MRGCLQESQDSRRSGLRQSIYVAKEAAKSIASGSAVKFQLPPNGVCVLQGRVWLNFYHICRLPHTTLPANRILFRLFPEAGIGQQGLEIAVLSPFVDR